MTEASLFLIVGIVAIVSAVAMLLTSNAVHSALFLILIMGCIAFLFLMLEAPFLFLVQITVYAGAIMVLFLFVIMLLGAEKLGGKSPLFRWMTPVAMVLALIFLAAAGLAMGNQVSTLAPAAGNPMVRIAHFAPDTGPMDIYANNELIASDVEFGESTDYLTLQPGEYNIALNATGTEEAAFAQAITIDAGLVGTAIAYGSDTDLALEVIPNDLTVLGDDNASRVVFFNAYTDGSASVSLDDLGSELDATDDRVLIEAVPAGELSQSIIVDDRTNLSNWAFVDDSGRVLFRLSDPEAYSVKADTEQFYVVAPQRLFDGTSRVVVEPLVTNVLPSFGGPVSVGRELFTRYLLPMQMVAVLLLVAMIGAIVLTHQKDYTPRPRRDQRRRVNRSLTSAISAQTGHDVMTQTATTQQLPEAVAEQAEG